MEVRKNPAHPNLLPNAQVMASVAFAYHNGAVQQGIWSKVACHARGRDYHKTLKQKLSHLASAIKKHFPKAQTRIFVDSAPILERTWAVLAGIGHIGRNGMLIVPGVGPKVLLGEIIISGVPTVSDTVSQDEFFPLCGECRLCISACPTGALHDDGTVNAVRCLSSISIEANRTPRESERQPASPSTLDNTDTKTFSLLQKGNKIFGCDICTDTCPLVQSTNSVLEFPRHVHLATDLDELVNMSNELLQMRLQDTALYRTGAEALKENASLLLGSVPTNISTPVPASKNE